MRPNGRRFWIIAALTLLAAAATYYMMNGGKTNGAKGEAIHATALSMWVYSQGWEAHVSEFQKEHPGIDVDVRYFRSSEQLYTELLASISANDAPQLAELQSFYGLAQLVDTKAVVPVDKTALPEWPQLIPAFVERYRYHDEHWAVPIGGSLPLLYYREELLPGGRASKLAQWSEAEAAAARPNPDVRESGSQRLWGMAMDKELPWYLENLSFTPADRGGEGHERKLTALSVWRSWVHEARLMEPLEHQRAASDFINGKAGLFIGSSDKLPTIEKYIGGKFAFDAVRLPELAQQGIVPGASALMMLQSAPAKAKAAASFVAFMLQEASQTALWRSDGLIPARFDVASKLAEEGTASRRQKLILESVPSFAVKPPDVSDYGVWTAAQDMLEQLELQADLPLERSIGSVYGKPARR
ncbi:extracellular solute-binding protein [Paenibacillus doosanensis]|uniref:Bacterial extracellular solute-binding protein n=1 Tax=Paenibacillus konkukensis TaxID=2020716 RepID=A0ABY4RRH3_9BACL|nr:MULTISPECIES: extracellular solute-binding protein [Paenibacillus]MCS7462074.1 extracellular solute-binding protein [Paenibacillus doosanensis]UQZ85141.1 Bacterial extracellular solute-binding protein [Paenibacillus konkukensis]